MKKLINKIKTSKTFKAVSVTLAVAMVAVMSCVSCFATDPDPIETQLTSAFSTVATQITNYAIIAIPSAAIVFALFFGVRKIFSFFKSLAK